MEEKYGRTRSAAKVENNLHTDRDRATDSESSTDSEEEDDVGILASEPLDIQIHNTLEAIRRKDPRVYDENAKFYTDIDGGQQDSTITSNKKERPMYLSDYHRKTLLEGGATLDAAENGPTSFAQQQDDLKNSIVKEMHSVADGATGSGEKQNDSDENGDDFLIRKPSILPQIKEPSQAKEVHKGLDPEAADEDPEKYLTSFMSARAWVPTTESRFQPFESDDDEDERRAEQFEEAYNLRFEDPNISNEKLLSHARDAAAKYSVRQEALNPRKRAREAERLKKESAKRIREEEKARLRKLKVAEAEEKVKKIRVAAGIGVEHLNEEDWSNFLEEGWDDAQWEQEMKKRFGEDYYAGQDTNLDDNEECKKKGKIKKPKWEDDIDINDIIPDFESEERMQQQVELTDEDSDAGGVPLANVEGSTERKPLGKSEPVRQARPSRKRNKDDMKKVARQERRKIERLVDQQLDIDETLSKYNTGKFRYRDTSPTAYGLTAPDILMASDSQLNQYAGLKKMASFRDSDKKRKDKKHLGKKARLRQWRRDTFGNEDGPQKTLAEVLAESDQVNKDSRGMSQEFTNTNKEGAKPRSRKHRPSKS